MKVGPSGSLFEDLAAGAVDIVVAIAPPSDLGGIRTERLIEEPLGVYRPGGGRAGSPDRWGPWVLFPDGSHTRSVIGDALRAEGATVEVVAESHQPDVLKEMVHLGLGWTVLPTIQAESGERPLVRAKVLTSRPMVVAVRSNAAMDPAVIALEKALVEAAGSLDTRPGAR
jgi:DNA-binding transcriptional LysR family regulator